MNRSWKVVLAGLACAVMLVALIWFSWAWSVAQEKAKKSSCISNLKQLGTALNMYLNDYYSPPSEEASEEARRRGEPRRRMTWYDDDREVRTVEYFGHAVAMAPSAERWPEALSPYLGSAAVLRCPTDTRGSPQAAGGHATSYTMNEHLSTYDLSEYLDPTAQPSGVVVLFDGVELYGSADAADLRHVSRHGIHFLYRRDGLNVLYLDWHARWETRESFSQAAFEP